MIFKKMQLLNENLVIVIIYTFNILSFYKKCIAKERCSKAISYHSHTVSWTLKLLQQDAFNNQNKNFIIFMQFRN